MRPPNRNHRQSRSVWNTSRTQSLFRSEIELDASRHIYLPSEGKGEDFSLTSPLIGTSHRAHPDKGDQNCGFRAYGRHLYITLRWQPVNRLQDTLGSHIERTAKSRSRFDSDSVIDRRRDSLLAAQVAFRRLNGDMPQKELDLLQFSSAASQSRAQVRRRSCGASFSTPILFAESFKMCQTAFSDMPSPSIRPILVTRRKSSLGRSPMHSTRRATLP